MLEAVQSARLTMVDNVTIALFVGILFAIVKVVSRQTQDMDTYYRANKSLPWSLAVGTIAASWFGGNGVIGTVGYSGSMGLAAWFIWSIGAHLSRFPLALWVAPRISVKVNSTMVDLLKRFYGKFAAVLGAIVLVAGALSISELASAGYIGVAAWGADKFVVAIIILIVSIVLASLGGLMGVAITDMVFFFLMINAVALVFPQALSFVGGMKGMETALNAIDPALMTPFGGLSIGRAAVLVLLCVNMYKDPAFYQRFSASNGPKTGKRAMLTCFSLWLTMEVCLMVTGMIVRCIDPNYTMQPEVLYIQLVLSYLPPVARGLFIVAMFGAIISTIDSYYLIAGEIVANDIISPLRKKPLTDAQSIQVTRISMVVFGIIALSCCFQFEFVYDAIILLTSLGMSVLFWPVLIAIMYDGKKTDVAGIASMITGILSWLWFKFNPVSVEALGGVLDPVLLSLPLGLVAYLIGNQFGTVRATSVSDHLTGGISVQQPLPIDHEEYKREVRVEWFGFDGAACLVYALLALLIGYGMINRVDWIIGGFVPAFCSIATTGIFVRYLFEVFVFTRKKK